MKRLTALLLALTMLLGFTACSTEPVQSEPIATGNSVEQSSETVTEAPAGTDKKEKVLRIAQGGAPTTLGMLRADGYCTSITQNISDALTRINDDCEIEPGLATSWEWVDENTWQFTLREGVTFTNGEAFNAEAVVYNLTSLTDRELSCRYASHWGDAWPITVEAVDEYTVNVVTSAPNAFVPNLLTRVVMYAPAQWQAEGDDEYLTHPSGVGPYEVESWDVGISLTLKKAETEYWDGDVYFDKVIIDAVASDASRISALQAGEYDLVEGIPYDQVSYLENAGGDYKLVVADTVGLNWMYFNGYNTTNEWIWNVKFREAVVHAIDQEGISEVLFSGICPVMQGPASPRSFGGNTDTQALSYDPELSKQLLQEIGYDGTLMRFNICTGEFANDVEVAEFITAQLTAVGINVELNQLDKSLLDDGRKAGECEFCMINTPGSFGGMSDYYWNQMTSKRGYDNGDESFKAVDAMFKAAVAYGLTDAERESKLIEANTALWELVPVLFAVSSNIVLGMNENLEGVRYAPNSWLYFKNAYYAG